MAAKGTKRAGRRVETLTQALAKLLEKELLPDLEARAKTPSVATALARRWEHERDRKRTAEKLDAWVEQALEQVGAAWILSCIFVRTLEDRGLVEHRRLAGEGAADSQHYFFELAPELGVRDYLLSVFRELGEQPGAEDLLGPAKNPAWRLSPSEEGARKLLEFFREPGEGGTGLRWTFGGEDTRFLGDLYQDLSAAVRERYALLQTPDFVERFILSLTLDPALKEFGLEGLRVIDPTCGSGHFLLGAYDRLFEERRAAAPGVERRVHAQEALAQVYGVDINPYAVAIARFRLTLAYVAKAGLKLLREVPRLPLNLVVADSLLHGARGQRRLAEVAEDRGGWHDELFTLDDEEQAKKVLEQGYHVVVGNPPYITCKDAALRKAYAERYATCVANYALAVPFTELFFGSATAGGFVGLINANSFMKREFGKKLVEAFLPSIDLSAVLDIGGAFIPGHGTPTVILLGRNRAPASDVLRAVLGRRGEPSVPAVPEDGKVWSSVARNYQCVGYEDEFVSVVDLERKQLSRHPWSLGGGGAGALKQMIEAAVQQRLSDCVEAIGFSVIIGEDEAFLRPESNLRWRDVPRVPIVVGEQIRDWTLDRGNDVVFPLTRPGFEVIVGAQPARELWPFRALLEQRVVSGSYTMKQSNRVWYDLRRFSRDKHASEMSITFAFVATHNHFVLDRGGRVFNRSAPIIKLPATATEAAHLALTGYLNSSAACFWMKQVFFDKGNRGEGGGTTAERWEKFFEFDGTKLAAFPLPAPDPRVTSLACLLDLAGRRWAGLEPAVVLEDLQCDSSVRSELERVQSERESVERKIRWLQEELDWEVYRAYGLHDCTRGALPADFATTPERAPGSRPADRLYAIEVRAGRVSERFFAMSALPSAAEVEAMQPDEVDGKRLEAIALSKELQLLEHPAYKRTFREAFRTWDAKPGLAEWLGNRVEGLLVGSAVVRPVRSLATALMAQPQVVEAASLLFGEEVDPVPALAALASKDAVPFLAAQRYAASGLATRAKWETTWDLQRREDAGEKVSDIPVPPKYGKEDYRSDTSWRLRGKLDVPKERFISYPGAEREGEGPLIGWAGWDHLQRAQALAALYTERRHTDGWPKEKLTPLLAGLLELVPWLKQWHDEPSAEHDGARLGSYFESFVQTETREIGLTLEGLTAWQP